MANHGLAWFILGLCFTPIQALSFADTLTSGLASVVRIPVAAGEGTTVATALASQPSASVPSAVTLYEFEACSYCRKVREAITVLDLDVLVKPCPRGSPFRKEVEELAGGKSQFPFLVDSYTGVSMSESDDIIAYLASTYGRGCVALDEVTERSSSPALTLASGLLASGLRGFRGGALSNRALPRLSSSYKLLKLYSYENNQVCEHKKVVCR
jgi:hypothetical protein